MIWINWEESRGKQQQQKDSRFKKYNIQGVVRRTGMVWKKEGWGGTPQIQKTVITRMTIYYFLWPEMTVAEVTVFNFNKRNLSGSHEIILTTRVVKHWYTLPGNVVELTWLEVFKCRLGKHCAAMVKTRKSLPWAGNWTRGLFQTCLSRMILGYVCYMQSRENFSFVSQ